MDFYPNFDETLLQPTVMPSRYPNLLVTAPNGIAVGMATNIPPHNLREVVDGCIHMIDHPDCTTEDLMQFIKGPDFPTGGIILGQSGIRAAYHTGRGRILCARKPRSRPWARTAAASWSRRFPTWSTRAKLVEKIAELVHEKRLDGISDIRDESDRNGMRIVIELKRDVHPTVVLNYLYKHTSMQETFGANMLALVNGEPKVLSLREMLYHYIAHQKDVVTRRTKYDLDKAEAARTSWRACSRRWTTSTRSSPSSEAAADTSAARTALMERFAFSDKQAQAILDMRLARLTGLERDKLQTEYDELEKSIAYYKSLLADEGLLMASSSRRWARFATSSPTSAARS